MYEWPWFTATPTVSRTTALPETDTIQFMFDWADRDKLRAAGDPLPGPGPFTVYRGVGRERSERQVDGMSWTLSFDVACYFALRGFHDPAVYQATVEAAEVYCFYNDRGEEEFICRPKESKRMKLTRKEIKKGSDRCAAAMKVWKARDQERLKQVTPPAEPRNADRHTSYARGRDSSPPRAFFFLASTGLAMPQAPGLISIGIVVEIGVAVLVITVAAGMIKAGSNVEMIRNMAMAVIGGAWEC